jgi:hypothetical protein
MGTRNSSQCARARGHRAGTRERRAHALVGVARGALVQRASPRTSFPLKCDPCADWRPITRFSPLNWPSAWYTSLPSRGSPTKGGGCKSHVASLMSSAAAFLVRAIFLSIRTRGTRAQFRGLVAESRTAVIRLPIRSPNLSTRLLYIGAGCLITRTVQRSRIGSRGRSCCRRD